MSGFCPFAVNRNIVPGSNDPAITPRVAILHVDAGNADSLYDYFKNRSGGIESHFFVKANGIIEQYRSIYFQADANLDANDFAVSIETQGFGDGKWNVAQLDSIKRLLVWLNAEAGIPLRKIRHWDGSGVGYHTLFGAPSHWTPVAKSCPGPERKVQFEEDIVPWMRRARTPDTVIATTNLNFGRPQRAQQHDLDAIDADIVLTQEDVRGKHRERVIVRGHLGNRVQRKGAELAALDRLGFKIRTRRFVWKNVSIPGVGLVRVISVHIAPRRMPALRLIYWFRLRQLIAKGPEKWIVGGDWNERVREDPAELKAAFGAKFYGDRIDSFAVSKALQPHVKGKVRSVQDPMRNDEHPVVYLTLSAKQQLPPMGER